jgi:hypothetical protein
MSFFSNINDGGIEAKSISAGIAENPTQFQHGP